MKILQTASVFSKSTVAGAVFATAFFTGTLPTAPLSSAFAQAPTAAGRALGTVKAINGGTLTVTTDAGATIIVSLAGATRVQQLAPGSTDLKTAEASTADAIAVGDRVLASGTPGDAGAITATRVILMKSSAIAQRNQTSQQDWTRRGSGGVVTAVDVAGKSIAVTSGARKISIATTGSTLYRRYTPGSVKFEEAKPGTLADIQPGDQLRVRGDKSADGATVTAEEIVTGTFKNLAGTVVSVDAAANKLVLKDLGSKKNETVTISTGSDLRAMPPEIAARFAASKNRPAAGGEGAPAAGGGEAASAGTAPARGAGGAGTGRAGAGRPGGTASGDLSMVIPRLPKVTLAELKPGEALMIVASGSGSGGPFTAITLLSGVEPLLTGPAGSELTIPPWSAAGGAEGAAE